MGKAQKRRTRYPLYILIAVAIIIAGLTVSIAANTPMPPSPMRTTKGICVSGPVLEEEWYDDLWLNLSKKFAPIQERWMDQTIIRRASPSQVLSLLSDRDVIWYCAVAHGCPQYAHFDNEEYPAYNRYDTLYASDLAGVMADRGPVRLSILWHCNAMADIGPGTWTYELTKGDFENCIVIGIHDYGGAWFDTMMCFFQGLEAGMTAGDAYDRALVEVPPPGEEHIPRLAGNRDLTIDDLCCPLDGDTVLSYLKSVLMG